MSGSQNRYQVPPTVTMLTQMKGRLLGATKGHALLKKKADALTVRYRQILKEIVEAKSVGRGFGGGVGGCLGGVWGVRGGRVGGAGRERHAGGRRAGSGEERLPPPWIAAALPAPAPPLGRAPGPVLPAPKSQVPQTSPPKPRPPLGPLTKPYQRAWATP
jgi:hypothetical protein